MTGRKDARFTTPRSSPTAGPTTWSRAKRECSTATVMEQALVRFGRFVNEVEGHAAAIDHARQFCSTEEERHQMTRARAVVQRYEAVGTPCPLPLGMADVAVRHTYKRGEMLWDNIAIASTT